MSYVIDQTNKLAQIYEETIALRVIANINAIFNGLLMFYLLLIGAGGMPLVATFCLFIINASFYFSSYLKDKRRNESNG
jgi:hypothetical protein